MVVSSQGEATNPKGESLAIFLIVEVNELVIIRVKDGYQRGCGCVSLWGSYTPKGGIP